MPRRSLDLKDYDAFTRELRDLRTRSYDRVGQWTLGQICDHVGLLMTRSMDGFDFSMPWYLRIGGPLIKRITLRTRRIPEGVRAPRIIATVPARDDAAAVDDLLALIERYRRHTAPLHPSPLFGRISREEWDQIHLIHASHHLSFLLPHTNPSPPQNELVQTEAR